MKIDKRELRRLALEDGLSQRQLAKRFRCSDSAVWQMCKRLGIVTRGDERRSMNGRKSAPKSIAYLKIRGQVQAALLGWPQARTRSQALLLRALWMRGPQTLTEALGRLPHTGDYHRTLAWLRRQGLVVGEQIGRRLMRWRLAPGVGPAVEARGA